MTYEAMIGGKEQVSVGTHEPRYGIKHYAVNGHEDWGEETRLGVEFNPVGGMII
jgi:hypothetical protein